MTEIAALRNVVSPAPRVIWQTVFDRDAEAVPYQSPQLDRCAVPQLSSPGPQQALHLRRRRADGAASGRVPPGSRRHGPGRVDALGLGIGGLVSTSPVTAEHVRAVVGDLITKAPYVRLKIRPNPRAADACGAAMPAGSPEWRTLSAWMAGSTRFGMAGCD